MKQSSAAVLALAAAVGFAACSNGNGSNNAANTNTGNTMTSGSSVKQMNPMHVAHNAMSGKALNINMGAMNGSKQDGSASIAIKGSGVLVTLHVNNEPAGAIEPAHIHQGTCKNLNPAPWKPLSNVVNGVSETTIAGVNVAELKKGHYAINVHKSSERSQDVRFLRRLDDLASLPAGPMKGLPGSHVAGRPFIRTTSRPIVRANRVAPYRVSAR